MPSLTAAFTAPPTATVGVPVIFQDNSSPSPVSWNWSFGDGTANNTNQNPITTSPTGAYIDDSVIQSDLKSIKQSAVKMSVGQKHEASQILKDWLDDGKGEDTDNKETDEESN